MSFYLINWLQGGRSVGATAGAERIMSTATLHSQRPVVEGEAHDLREELERLQSAIASMSRALGEANRARGLAEGRRQATENELANHRVMLDEANELRAALEHRLTEMEREFAVTRSELARQ